jgi:hypothetical protein
MRAALDSTATRVEESRRHALGPDRPAAGEQVPTDVALCVVIVGVACCVIGWRVAPAGQRPDVAEGWYALALSTMFWMAAVIAAIGLYLRLRRGLLAALACAMSFLGAVVVDAVLDPTVLGARWGVELGCAALFWCAVAGALLFIDRDGRI